MTKCHSERAVRAKNPYDATFKFATTQGFFAPYGAQNDIKKQKDQACGYLIVRQM